jgi:cyclic beta-1,2-glucan synthetase
MAVELSSAGRSDFSRIFAGQGGTDPYGCDSGELYMDMFNAGGFSGKGIIDAEAYLDCMEWRIPDNTVLSLTPWKGEYLGVFHGVVDSRSASRT